MAVLTYKCPNCGGPLNWDAEKKAWFCNYCNSRFTEADYAKMRPESAASGPADLGEDGALQTAVYSCPSCGARIMADETTAASFCYYCHNPVVLEDRLSGALMPDLVLPFEIDEKKAREIFSGWVRRHRYIPKDFYSEKQVSYFSGVYFPYWIYSCRVQGELSADGKKLRTWTSGGMQFTETSVYDASQNGTMTVEHMTRIALKKASRILCESVMPFQMEKMKPYAPGYLQGYSAEMRDIAREELSGEISAEVDAYAKERLQAAASEGYNSLQVRSIETRIEEEQWHYALLPVWTLTCQDVKRGKTYYFSINGQSGKTCGELPVDGRRLLWLFFMIFAPVFAVILCFLYFVL